ncbi:peptidoglycan synthetase [Flavihumibacter sp. R14]|nr:peptidoglycan synthetase [Flavihumibacter soli]
MRVHFIAIGGSAMHNLAIALSKKGFHVTGSDDVVFEPSKSRLNKYGLLPASEGWNTDNITSDLDAVILGMHARPDNPELKKAMELGLKVYSYPEYIYEQSRQKKRVVIGGSHGKTTITSMILHVLNYYNYNFDYLVGAQLAGFETMVKLTDEAPVIILEGDEYLSSPIDRRPKFHLYHANVAVISGIAWDHINVFPTYEEYYDQFVKFLDTIEDNGKVIYYAGDTDLARLMNDSSKEITKIPYGSLSNKVENGITRIVTDYGEIPLNIFGNHNILNLNAARLVCLELDVKEDAFFEAIKTFNGAARRLESLGKNANTAVFKDFAHSPSKLVATIDAVKKQFPDRKLIALIELHTFSSLNKDFLNQYAGTMDAADEAIVFIDDTIFLQKQLEPYDEFIVKKSFDNTRVNFFNNVEILERFLSGINYKGKNLLLMSSGNFGGMDLDALTGKILSSSPE